MKYGLHFPNFGAFNARTLAEIAKEAEDSGWDGVFLWDHINRIWEVPVYDPWISLAAIAMVTEKVRIGTLVTPLARRRPQKVARECVTLDRLSKGRLILGVGIGSDGGRDVEWANFGEELDLKIRAEMTDEALHIITELWSGRPFSFKGEHYTVRDSRFYPLPQQQPRIPIWVAGNYPNKPPMRRAARWDGMFLQYRNQENIPQVIDDSIKYVHQHRDEELPFDVVYFNEGNIADDTSELRQQVEAVGVTWWIESIVPQRFGSQWEDRWDVDAMRDFIRQGAPSP